MDRKRLRVLFRGAHAMAKCNRPFSDYEWLVCLDIAKGLEVRSTYRTAKACKEFNDHIARVTQDNVLAEIELSVFRLNDGWNNRCGNNRVYSSALQKNGVVTMKFFRLAETEGTSGD